MSNPTDQPIPVEPLTNQASNEDAPVDSKAPENFTGDDDILSTKVTLADLCAKGTSQYAVKNYMDAMDYYAQASELQAEINGEMAPENAEILFLYGRSLYKVGQSKSNVLGISGAGEKKKPKSKPKAAKLDAVTEEEETEKNGAAAELSKPAEPPVSPPRAIGDAPKPFFQFTGDENFEDSDDEEEAEGGDEDEEEEDELQMGFEILDLARVLFERRLQQPEEEVEGDSKGKGKAVEDSSMTKHIKERLADTHDLLAEISLENERFPQAISDSRASLAYKQDLYPKESEIVAEAHFKLSLALEFGSITTTSDANEESEGKEGKETAEASVNEEMRAEAASQLELAIESTKLKLHNKEVSLAETSSPEENDTTRAQIANVKDMLSEMEQRLVELRAPAGADVKALLSDSLGASNGAGSITDTKEGESRADVNARIEEAQKNANDLTGLVRKKAPKVKEDTATLPSHGKRKASDEVASDSKKAKVDDE